SESSESSESSLSESEVSASSSSASMTSEWVSSTPVVTISSSESVVSSSSMSCSFRLGRGLYSRNDHLPNSAHSHRPRYRGRVESAAVMDLYEYQGKELFRRSGIPVSEGRLARTPDEARAAAEELGGPVVVKSQVLTGGRGKAGGIKLADGPEEAEARARDILGLDIGGHVVRKLWVERASD